jgi:hypothetical protein
VLYLRFNRKLLWVALPAVLWAYLGLCAALAQLGPAVKPPFGLRLGLPPGALELRGRLVEVREEKDKLYIAVAAPPGGPQQAFSPDGEPVPHPPPGVELKFLTPEEAAGRELTVQTLRGQTRPIELRGPGHRQVIECQRYVIGLGPRGIALIPNEGRALGRLERLLERPGGEGPPPPFRPFRDRRRDRLDERRNWRDGHGPQRPGGGGDFQPGQGRGEERGPDEGPQGPPPAGSGANQPLQPIP